MLAGGTPVHRYVSEPMATPGTCYWTRQRQEKFDNRKIFAINVRQEYNSSTYADDEYLFLLVDMTDTDAPQIKVRTWQPNVVVIEKLYNAGDFFND